MENKQKTEKKRTNMPLVILVLVFVIALVVVGMMNKNNNKNTTKNTAKTTNTKAEQEISEEMEDSLIDMNNTENAKITADRKENTSETLSQDKTYQGMTITEIELFAEDGQSHFRAKVENNSGTDYAGGKLTLVFTKKDGSTIEELVPLLPSIANGSYNYLDANTTTDITNAYDVTIK